MDLRPPGWRPGCLACEPAVRTLLHDAASNTYAPLIFARWPLSPPRVLYETSTADSPAAVRDLSAPLDAPFRSAASAPGCCPACLWLPSAAVRRWILRWALCRGSW